MKIAIIGAGQVGASFAQRVIENELADVVLIDIEGDMAKGKALDMIESGPILGFDSTIVGNSDYSMIRDADICVVTAGFPRLPGMDREDLLVKNISIIREIGRHIKRYAPESIILNVTNPVDILSYVLFHVTEFPKERVIGMAGVLDTARLKAFISMELKISVENISALVLGCHGDLMVPLIRYSCVSGIPIDQIMEKESINRIITRTINGGTEIVKLLKKGGAYYTPGASIYQMVESIIRNKRRILPASVYTEGEYGLEGTFVGLPVILGQRGIEEILQLKLNTEEKNLLMKSAMAVKATIKNMKDNELF